MHCKVGYQVGFLCFPVFMPLFHEVLQLIGLSKVSGVCAIPTQSIKLKPFAMRSLQYITQLCTWLFCCAYLISSCDLLWFISHIIQGCCNNWYWETHMIALMAVKLPWGMCVTGLLHDSNKAHHKRNYVRISQELPYSITRILIYCVFCIATLVINLMKYPSSRSPFYARWS